jgi:ribokinase
VLVVGSINADLIVTVARHPAPGETVLGDGGEVLPGGKGANQAVAAARLGAATAIVGAIGMDPNAEPAISGLRAAGVHLAAVSTRPGPTGLAVVTVASDGENTIVVVPGANATVTPGDLEAHRGLFDSAAVVVVQGELPRATIEAAVRMTAAGHARLILNLAPAIDLDPDVVRRADPLVVNEHEAAHALRLLSGAQTSAEPPRQAEQSQQAEHAEQAGRAEALCRAGVLSVVITIGAAGALVIDPRSGPVRHLPAPAVEVRDTTGAGDAFVGALAARLAAGDGVLDAAGMAVRVAAASVRRTGAQPSYPTTADPLP